MYIVIHFKITVDIVLSSVEENLNVKKTKIYVNLNMFRHFTSDN